MTVQPVAADLGFSVDSSCDRDDPKCVRDAIAKFNKKATRKNILICWEHDALTNILKELGKRRHRHILMNREIGDFRRKGLVQDTNIT